MKNFLNKADATVAGPVISLTKDFLKLLKRLNKFLLKSYDRYYYLTFYIEMAISNINENKSKLREFFGKLIFPDIKK